MNLELVINERLKLQSTQRSLAAFNLEVPNVNALRSAKFAQRWDSLSDSQRQSATRILGGAANFKRTTNYLNDILGAIA